MFNITIYVIKPSGESKPPLGVNPIIDAVTLLHYTNTKKYKYTIVGNRTKMHSSSEEFVPPVQTSSPRVGLFLLLVPLSVTQSKCWKMAKQSNARIQIQIPTQTNASTGTIIT